MRSKKYAILPLFMAESPKFPRAYTKSGSRNTVVTSDFRPEVDKWPFRACAVKIRNIALIYGRIAEILASFRKSGSWNTMVSSDVRPEVEKWPFCACAVQNTLYCPYLWQNLRNSRALYEIGVEKHDGDVRC